MREDVKVVLVSNRGPVSFIEENGSFKTKRGAGGLAGALDPVARRLGDRAVWIAAANSDADRAAVQAGEDRKLRDELGYPLRMLDIDPETYSAYYNSVSNRMLWFANHCLWDELGIGDFGDEELDSYRTAYEPVNKRFASEVAEVASEKTLVLFQDYHLATAPRHLRAVEGDFAVLHFTHSSFCGPRGLERLPDPIPREVIEGMLGADLVGFHTIAWASGFMRCCEELGAKVDRDGGAVAYKGRTSWVRAYPIPIDPRELIERAEGEPARRWAARLRSTEGYLLVRADRAEPSKNIVRGFEAFGRLLDRRPDMHGRARFIACLYPSRTSMREYQQYTAKIRSSVARVNARHPDAIELFLKDDYDRTLGALSVYDALLVNSIMDGMNLVSKEGPTINHNDGVLILSSGAGSFDELGAAAVAIDDPLDVDETASAIETAFEMPPADRARRSSELRETVRARRPRDWIDAQLEDLSEISEGREPMTPAGSGDVAKG